MFGIWWLKYAIIGVVIVGFLAYIETLRLEKSHYEAKAASVQAEFDIYKHNAEAMQAALKSSNEAITLQYKQELNKENQAVEAKNVAIKERIKADEAAKHIVIPPSSVSVLDATAAGTGGQQSTPTVTGDASGTQASITLNDVEGWSADEQTNHQECINQVHEWQHFWRDFSTGVQSSQQVRSGTNGP